MKTVLFACIHNAGRSQMAAAFFNALDKTGPRAISAGTHPLTTVHPEVVETMREVGIDLANAKPQLFTEELAMGADLLVTMGCGDACPVIPGLRKEDWPIPDPKDQPPEQVRKIRDDIRERVLHLLTRMVLSAMNETNLLPILHAIQDRLGYIPKESIAHIATHLNLSQAEQ